MENACYYSVEKLLSSSLFSKKLKVRIYKTVILPVVLYGCETWTPTLREEQRLMVFKNKITFKNGKVSFDIPCLYNFFIVLYRGTVALDTMTSAHLWLPDRRVRKLDIRVTSRSKEKVLQSFTYVYDFTVNVSSFRPYRTVKRKHRICCGSFGE
ncbi:hypothetical protein ANN_20163 [Periplaneta americana]|uniref:Uncharacterized protein n=1 Tax=Periplaneta americana TaxID=6978 RepID=A0ABQ8SBV6_PERAM|nr:hypothetical protein ANN_20163 [Periplaneta americana]